MLLELVSMLPWWAGLLLAVVTYVVLHSLATPPQPGPLQPGQVGVFVGKAMFSSLAGIGQYLLPLICVVAAGVSFWKRRERNNLVTTVAQSKSADALDGMSWQDFEKLVGESFRQQGYSVVETGGGGADGGVDLVLTKNNEKFLVQCKQWKAFKVGVDVVRELYGVMAAKGATGGFVVTSGVFTDEAKSFSSGRNVDLIDGQRLFGMIQRARQSTSPAVVTPRSPTPTATTSVTAACPLCGAEMVKRTAKKGANAGSQFWGCIKYPSCRGTRSL